MTAFPKPVSLTFVAQGLLCSGNYTHTSHHVTTSDRHSFCLILERVEGDTVLTFLVFLIGYISFCLKENLYYVFVSFFTKELCYCSY